MEFLKKANGIMIFSALIILGLHLGAPVLIPFTVAAFLATLVYPVIAFLERKTGIGKIFSSLIGMLLVFLGIGLLTYFFIDQLVVFIGDIADRQDQILTFIRGLQDSVEDMSGFSVQQQEDLIMEKLGDLLATSQNVASQILAGTMGFALEFLLVLVFVFLLLLNRGKFKRFVMIYTRSENEDEAKVIIDETRRVAHKYLWGRIQVMALLAVMYFVLFTAYDLRHTWLLILFGSLITIIPYLGPFLSAVLPMLFMVIFGESSLEIISFGILIFIVQLIESYVFEPIIIGAEVHQSPLFVIIAILVGGSLWGPVGLILFVPLFAILKILFDHSSHLRPVGFLMGYEREGSGDNFVDKIKEKIKK